MIHTNKVAWLAAGFLLLLVTACSGGSYSIRSGQLGSTSNSISGNYSSFSGNYFREEKFVQGEQIEFHVSRHTKEGTISAQLIDSSGSVIATLTSDETIRIPKTDTYRIEVTANHHQGDFDVTWRQVGNH